MLYNKYNYIIVCVSNKYYYKRLPKFISKV